MQNAKRKGWETRRPRSLVPTVRATYSNWVFQIFYLQLPGRLRVLGSSVREEHHPRDGMLGMSNREKRRPRRKSDPSMHADEDGNLILTPSGYCYKFHPKHHHPSKGGDACWLRSVSRSMEFGMFHEADRLHLVDGKGNYYNVLRDGDSYLEIGTRHENLAKFWKVDSNRMSHGFPVWPIKTRLSRHRKGQDDRPPAAALQRMVDNNIITSRDKMLLLKGDNI